LVQLKSAVIAFPHAIAESRTFNEITYYLYIKIKHREGHADPACVFTIIYKLRLFVTLLYLFHDPWQHPLDKGLGPIF
jgi:hypothetical protein